MWFSSMIVPVCAAVFARAALAEEPPVVADPFERTSLVELAEWLGDGMTLELRLAPAPFYRIEVSRQALLETGEAPWLAVLTADAFSLHFVPALTDEEALAPATERAIRLGGAAGGFRGIFRQNGTTEPAVLRIRFAFEDPEDEKRVRECRSAYAADVNCDGDVNSSDLHAVLTLWTEARTSKQDQGEGGDPGDNPTEPCGVVVPFGLLLEALRVSEGG